MRYLLNHKGLLALAAAVVFVALISILTAITGGRSSPISAFVGTVTKPFQSAVVGIADGMASLFGSSYRFEILEEENETLRKRIAEMEENERLAQSVSEENERLRRLLGLSERHRDFTWETAAITQRGASNWASTFTINKGADSGLEPQSCVVSEEGYLIGFLSEVGPTFSTVTTLVDTDMECGAYVFRSDEAGVAEGNFDLMQQNLLRLSYLQKDTDLRNGDLVLTSGVGGLFPRDLVIGTVQSVYVDESGISAYAVLAPSVDLSAITHVAIIKSFDISE